MIHLVNTYKHPNPAEQARLQRAASTWNQSGLENLLVETEELPRTSDTILGDTRKLPFIRDLIEKGFLYGNEICLTNADSCLPRDFQDFAIAPKGRVAYSHRRNFSRFPKMHLSVAEILQRGKPFVGVDLVVFDRTWWNQEGYANFPDLVLGCEGWDWVFKFWPNSLRLEDCVYHEYHYPPYWMANRKCPAELWNKMLCLKWVAKQPNREKIESDWPTLEEYARDMAEREVSKVR